MIFVGEHASITHSWIASALESGIRGSVQLLLGRLRIHAKSSRVKINAKAYSRTRPGGRGEGGGGQVARTMDQCCKPESSHTHGNAAD